MRRETSTLDFFLAEARRRFRRGSQKCVLCIETLTLDLQPQPQPQQLSTFIIHHSSFIIHHSNPLDSVHCLQQILRLGEGWMSIHVRGRRVQNARSAPGCVLTPASGLGFFPSKKGLPLNKKSKSVPRSQKLRDSVFDIR